MTGRYRTSCGAFEGRRSTPPDGFLASFDGPARAIRGALATAEATRPLGIDLHLGLHTGECEVRGDNLGGLAVHIAARVSSLAGPGEVLVSSTVKDLVAGSGTEFVHRGEHRLKGVPGSCRLYRAMPLPPPRDPLHAASYGQPRRPTCGGSSIARWLVPRLPGRPTNRTKL